MTDDLIYRRVLDHGWVRLRNLSGPVRREAEIYDADDVDPARAARMSFGRADEARAEAEDLRLCRYLMKHRHTSPFEMIECWIEMKLPIFVARQFVRHRTVSINEVSARYVTLPAEWYVPEPQHVGVKPEHVKQGRTLAWDELSVDQRGNVRAFLVDLDVACARSYADYVTAIEHGIPNELARCFLHLNHYTHWLWKQDLHNVMHFLSLRDHSHAQYEARQYARAITDLLKTYLPHTMGLYDVYRRQGAE